MLGIKDCVQFTYEEYLEKHEMLVDAYYRNLLFEKHVVDTDIGTYYVENGMCVLRTLNMKALKKNGTIHIPLGFDKIDVGVRPEDLNARLVDLGSVSYFCLWLPVTVKVLYAPYLKVLYNFTLSGTDLDLIYAPSIERVGFNAFGTTSIKSGVIGAHKFNKTSEFDDLVNDAVFLDEMGLNKMSSYWG